MTESAVRKAAHEFWMIKEGYVSPSDFADFALSLLQWKDVADGLPEVDGEVFSANEAVQGGYCCRLR